jgi:hypothetical protein
MNTESRTCQNCKNSFNIESDDFSFYEKIGVPAPTFCPECRMIRRFLWRNNRSLHKRNCGLCNKTLISMYKDDGSTVYCIDCYNGDGWDNFKYAKDIDWSKDFFSQLFDLFKKQPRIYQYRLGTVINSDYGNSVVNSKNAYLSYSVIDCEDVMYSEGIDRSKNTLDSFASYDLDSCYYNILSDRNYNSHFLLSSRSCIDSYFLYDCTNCQNCCLSSNLRNQQYVFRNKKLSKEEYQKAVEDLNLSSHTGFSNSKNEFIEIYRNAIHKYADIVSSQNVTGDFIINSKDVFRSFDISNMSENVRYSSRIIKAKDIVDSSYVLTGEMIYESLSASSNSYRQICSFLCFTSKYMEYCLFCKNCSNCFGCIGINNSEYCIFNKQYTKDEYLDIVDKLRQHMMDNPYIDSKGRIYTYGEFYPFEFSPFGYNETVAIDYFPKSEDEATKWGYPWKQNNEKNNTITKYSSDLLDSIENTEDSILNETIECSNHGKSEYQCTTAFRVTAIELEFYRNKGLPLPRTCPNCRHYERLAYRNPMKLSKKICSCDKSGHSHEEKQCQNEFETTYDSDLIKNVFCEQCYQKEVL